MNYSHYLQYKPTYTVVGGLTLRHVPKAIREIKDTRKRLLALQVAIYGPSYIEKLQKTLGGSK